MFLSYISNISEDYIDAPGLDPELPWYDDLDEATALAQKDIDTEIIDAYDVDVGDIISANVYQDNKAYMNLKHLTRPFLVTSKTNNKVYGFQLTHEPAQSVKDYAIPIEDFVSCGLNKFGYIVANMVRGVDYSHLNYKIGHLTDQTKDLLLDKLYDIRSNKDGKYSNCLLSDRIDKTIENIHRIIV